MAKAKDAALSLLFPHEHMARSVGTFQDLFFPQKKIIKNVIDINQAVLAGMARNPVYSAPLRALPNVSREDLDAFAERMEERVPSEGVRAVGHAIGNPQIQAVRNLQDMKRSVRSGLLQNTLIHKGLSLMPGLEEEDIEAFAERMNEDVRSPSIRKIGNITGKYGPNFYVATKFFKGFEMMSRGALVASSARVAARVNPARLAATATPRGAAMAMMEGSPGLAASILARSSMVGPARAAHKVVAHSKDFAGIATKDLVAKPGITRLTEAVGRSVGIGTFSASYEALTEDDMDAGTIASAFAFGALFTMGLEGFFMLGGRAMSQFAKRVNLSKAVEHEAQSMAPSAKYKMMADAQSEIDAVASKVAKARAGMSLQKHVVDQLSEFETAGFISQTSKQVSAVAKQTKKVTAELRKQEMSIRAKRQAYDAMNNTVIQGEIIPFSIRREVPFDPRGALLEVRKLMLNTIQSPEELGGSLGINANKIVRAMTQGRVHASLQRTQVDDALSVNMTALAKAMKVPESKIANGDFAREVHHMANKHGMGAVRAKYGDDVARLVQEPYTMMDDLYSVAESMGAQPKIVPEAFGVKMYMPHIDLPLSNSEYQKRLLKHIRKAIAKEHPGKTKGELDIAALDRVSKMMKYKEAGVHRFGSFDKERTIPGALQDLADKGLPFERNPYTIFSRYMDKLNTRITDAKIVGWNGENVNKMREIVAAEGGSEALFGNIMDTFFGKNIASEHARRLAQNITNLQIAAKLTYAPIPNSMQTVTTTLPFVGIEATAKGMRTLARSIKDPSLTHRIDMQVGHMDGLFQSLRRTAMGGTESMNRLDRYVDWMMKANGFTTGERLNRMLAGTSAFHYINNTIAKALGGKLRGNALTTHRARFQKLDLDFDKVVRTYRAGGELSDEVMSRAIYLGAEYTQFIPHAMRRPALWNHPAGRVITQFNSFVMGQFNFQRNYVISSAAQGDLGPLATVFATYPIAGEFVGGSLEILKGRARPDDPMLRVVENASLVGGMGIATSIWQAAQWDRLLSVPAGPTLSDAASWGSGIHQTITTGEVDRIARWWKRQPAVTFAIRSLQFGVLTLDDFMEEAERDEPTAQPVTLNELIQRNKQSRPSP